MKQLQNFKSFKEISVDTIIKRKKRNINNVCRYWLWILDDYLWWIVENELIVIGAWSGVGKAQDLDSKILTTNWFQRMWDIKIWDTVFWNNWKEETVVWIYPQWKKDIYEVIFNDWTKTRCCEEHLWVVQNITQRKKQTSWYKYNITTPLYSTLQLKDIKDDLWTNRLKYSIDINKPVEFKKKDLLLDPYTLGVLLWDWSFSKIIRLSNSEIDIISKIILLDSDMLVYHWGGKEYWIKRKIRNNKKVDIYNIIKDYWLLWCHSYDKFIPKDYLYSSIEDRISLLQWLCDTDWHVIKKTWNRVNSQIEFSTTSERLKEDFIFLVRSLWWKLSFTKRKSFYKKDWISLQTKDHYRVYITMPNWIYPVSSKKHLEKYQESKWCFRKYIKEIKYFWELEAQCIMVDNEEHMYLTDDFIWTHNTDLSINIALTNAMRWKKVALFSLEWDVWEITYRYFQRHINRKIMTTDEWKILRGPEYRLNLRADIEDIEKEVYKEIPEELDNLYIFDKTFIPNRETLLKLLKDTYKEFDLFIIDHLHYLDFWENEYSGVSEIVKSLKEMTELMEKPVVLVSHLNRKNSDNKRLPTIFDLHWSSNIEKNANTVILIAPDLQTEYLDLRSDKAYLRPTKLIVGKNRTWMPVPAIFDLTYDLRTKEYRKDDDLNSLSVHEDNKITKVDKILWE